MLTVKILKDLMKNEIKAFQITTLKKITKFNDKISQLANLLKDIGLDNEKVYFSIQISDANKEKIIKRENFSIIQCTIKDCTRKKSRQVLNLINVMINFVRK